jgi:glycosyltransferase involved in cell wall biosynthesis
MPSKENLKLIYLSFNDISKARTNSLSDVHFCEGIALNNVDITLIAFASEKRMLNIENIKRIYDLQKNFEIKLIKVPGTLFRSRILNLFLIIAMFAKYYINTKNTNIARKILVGTRNKSIAFLLYFLNRIIKNYVIFYWLHEVERGKLTKKIYKNIKKLLFTNINILNDVSRITDNNYPINSVTSNPVTESTLNFGVNKEEARELIEYSENKPLLAYTGKLYIGMKEIEYYIHAAKVLKEYNFIFTGGKHEVLEQLKEKFRIEGIKNIKLTGFLQNYGEVKIIQKAADILLSYYSKFDHQTDYNLPQKIIEYMAAGNILITPDYKSTQDLLNDSNAVFVEPENPAKLTEKIAEVAENLTAYSVKGLNASLKAKELTFKKILERNLLYLTD